MKWMLPLIVLTTVACTALFYTQQRTHVIRPAQAPNFLVTHTQHLHDLPKQETWIHFWASWCAPCVIEHPKLLRAFQTTPERTLILVSLDKNKQAITKFIEGQDTDIKNILTQKHIYSLWDKEGNIAELYQSFQYPETYILNRNFELIKKIKGTFDNN